VGREGKAEGEGEEGDSPRQGDEEQERIGNIIIKVGIMAGHNVITKSQHGKLKDGQGHVLVYQCMNCLLNIFLSQGSLDPLGSRVCSHPLQGHAHPSALLPAPA
jgi:hypothetical protein